MFKKWTQSIRSKKEKIVRRAMHMWNLWSSEIQSPPIRDSTRLPNPTRRESTPMTDGMRPSSRNRSAILKNTPGVAYSEPGIPTSHQNVKIKIPHRRRMPKSGSLSSERIHSLTAASSSGQISSSK
jgi:hypothetical protein